MNPLSDRMAGDCEGMTPRDFLAELWKIARVVDAMGEQMNRREDPFLAETYEELVKRVLD